MDNAYNLAEDMEEIVYLSDINTYELLYLNPAGRSILGIDNYKGKKCYEVLQGRNSRCEYCTNNLLNQNKYYIWESSHVFLNRPFLLKEKLILWENKLVKIEIASEKKTVLLNSRETVLLNCIELLQSKDNLNDVIYLILSEIGRYYHAFRVSIFKIKEAENIAENIFEWCMNDIKLQKEFLQCLDLNDIERWISIFHQGLPVVIKDIKELKTVSFIEYQILATQGLKGFAAVAIELNKKVMGFITITVENGKEVDTSFLSSLQKFIAEKWNWQEEKKKLEYEAYHESITGFFNFNKYCIDVNLLEKSIYSSIGVFCISFHSKRNQYNRYLILSIADILKDNFEENSIYQLDRNELVILCLNVEQDDFMDKIRTCLLQFNLIKEISIFTGYKWKCGNISVYYLIDQANKSMLQQQEKNLYQPDELVFDVSCECNQYLKYKKSYLSQTAKIQSSEEIAYRKRIFEYDLIVQQSYSEIYEINLSKDRIYLIHKKEDKLISFPAYYSVRETINRIGIDLIHPDDRKTFFDAYNSKNLRQYSEENEVRFEIEYRRKGKDEAYYWVSSHIKQIIFPDELSDSEDIILLLLLEDINDKVIEREKLRHTENKYYLALKKSCAHICDINIAHNTYHMSADEEITVFDVPEYGNYDEQVEAISNNLIYEEDKQRWKNCMMLENMLKVFYQGKKEISIDYRIRTIKGDYIWRNNLAVYLKGNHKRDDSIIIIAHNIEAQKKVEQLNLKNELLRQEISYQKEMSFKDARYRIVVEQTGAAVFEWDDNEKKDIFVTWAMALEYGFRQKDRNFFYFLLNHNKIYKKDIEKFSNFLKRSGETYKEVICRVTKDGQNYIWNKFTLTIVTEKDRSNKRIIGTMLDVDEEINVKEKLEQKAEQDFLTGILNQETFYAKAEILLKTYPERDYAVIIMDIDKFKVINDMYSMEGGNRILMEIAALINKCLTDHDICARVYADVFYIMADCPSNISVVRLINEIKEGLEKLNCETLLVPFFGISRSVDDDTTITNLCEMAGFAHKYVKETNFNKWTFYDETIRQKAILEKQIEKEMEYALENGQFHVYLQPKYLIATKEVIGAEALVRWIHPVKGLIPPSEFIPLFEKNGFILKLDEYIWEQVCILLKKWIEQGRTLIPISVNVSRLHLHSLKFRTIIINLLEKYNIPRKFLELELTESLFFGNLDRMIKVLSDLQKDGFTLDMDDFGSGYSSLNVLRNIPIDVLKIDCAFLDNAIFLEKGKTIIKYIVAMANDLNMHIIAEGIETIEQEQFLLEMGCSMGQGFYFSRPITIEEFEKRY